MTANSKKRLRDKTIEEAAAYWAMRLDSPDCSPSDRMAFEAWREERKAHAEAYERVARALRLVDRHLISPEILALGESVVAETEPGRRPRRRMTAIGLAASLLLAAGAAYYGAWFADTESPPAAEIRSAYETGVGERSTVGLPDGSTLVLNTATRVEVDYSRDARYLRLTGGQALFEVVKDVTRPFVVTAGNRRIVALGTAFDVRMDATTGVQVTLIEGRVSVDEVTAPSPGAATAAPPVSHELEPGEQLIARDNAAVVVTGTDVERVVSWREGQLVFRDDPLGAAVEEVNRYSTTQVFIDDDPRLHDLRVSGVFRAGRSDSFVLALESVYPVRSNRNHEEHITLSWKESTKDD